MLGDRIIGFLKESDERRIEETHRFMKLLQGTPQLEQLLREKDEQRVGKIRQLLARREQNRERRTAELPRLEAEVETARTAKKDADAAAAKAAEAVEAAEHARLSLSLDLSLEEQELETGIRELTLDEIQDLKHELRALDEKARQSFKFERKLGPKSKISGLISTEIFNSNRTAVDSLQAYIKNCLDEADAMIFSTMTREQIVARLQAMRDGLPKSDQFVETMREFPDTRELQKRD